MDQPLRRNGALQRVPGATARGDREAEVGGRARRDALDRAAELVEHAAAAATAREAVAASVVRRSRAAPRHERRRRDAASSSRSGGNEAERRRRSVAERGGAHAAGWACMQERARGPCSQLLRDDEVHREQAERLHRPATPRVGSPSGSYLHCIIVQEVATSYKLQICSSSS